MTRYGIESINKGNMMKTPMRADLIKMSFINRRGRKNLFRARHSNCYKEEIMVLNLIYENRSIQSLYNSDSTIIGRIHGRQVNILFDSGAVVTLLNYDLYEHLRETMELLLPCSDSLVSVSGDALTLLWEVNTELNIDFTKLPMKMKVVKDVSRCYHWTRFHEELSSQHQL